MVSESTLNHKKLRNGRNGVQNCKGSLLFLFSSFVQIVCCFKNDGLS